MTQNIKVVFRYQDGRIVKGYTSDFSPNKETFHAIPHEPPNADALEVRVPDLKAVFFVKDFKGNPDHIKSNEFDRSRPIVGRKIKVVFKDKEVLIGTTQGYQPSRPGFFVVPADPKSNNERCFVVSSATTEVSFIE
jgi:hypothetical protein